MMKHYLLLLILVLNALMLTSQDLYFPPLAGDAWETMSPEELGWCPEQIDSLYQYLEESNTRAFLLLKDGRIVLEQYFGQHTQSTPWYWASAGKTLTAFMVGIAQQEDLLSISDPSADYLGAGWTSCTPPQEEAITVWHQLTMSSGLDDGVPDPTCFQPECLQYLADPGTRWAYHNGPYTILDQVVEQAAGQPLNAYINQKLKLFTGMSGSFVMVDNNNVFFSTARSMARFGLLMLGEGAWNGFPVMSDSQYFHDMVNPSQSLNESYGYLWWLNGQSTYMLPGLQVPLPGPLIPNAPADMYSAMGLNGQFLNVVPSEGLVCVRMGDAPTNEPVPYLLNDQIWARINDLACTPVATEEQEGGAFDWEVFPNPATGFVQVRTSMPMVNLRVFDARGQLVLERSNHSTDEQISVTEWAPGVYWLRWEDASGLMSGTRKLVIY